MFKAPLTAVVVSQFLSSYQSIDRPQSQALLPYVYVDQNQVKLLTNVVNESEKDRGQAVFALSVAGDGWVEMLAIETPDE
jgi:hypothetical protein